MWVRKALWIVVPALLGCNLGCPSHTRQSGTTGISVVSVTRWTDYQDELQPTFAITPETAFAQGLADTTQSDFTQLDSFRAGLSVSLAPSSALPATQPTNGDALGESPAGPTTAPTVLQKDQLAVDPYIKYTAATALYSHVKLLNRYVRDAAVPDKYMPYVIRLQVSSTPGSRAADYDLHANVAFYLSPVAVEYKGQFDAALSLSAAGLAMQLNQQFNNLPPALKRIEEEAAQARLSRIKAALTAAQEHLRHRENDAADRRLEEARGLAKESGAESLIKATDEKISELLNVFALPALDRLQPVVIPLLVADQIEASLEATRLEKMRQYVLSLAAGYAGIGADVDLAKVDAAIAQANARSFNSRLSVSRLADNSVKIRIGARRNGVTVDGEPTYEAVPQTHHISLLLMVPNDPAPDRSKSPIKVYAACKSEIILADGTKESAPTTVPVSLIQSELGTEAAGLFGSDSERWQRAIDAVASNDSEAFYRAAGVRDAKTAADIREKLSKGNRLWLELQARGAINDVRTTQFEVRPYEVPKPGLPATMPASKGQAVPVQVYMIDDGKVTTAVLNGAYGVEASQIDAVWSFDAGTESGIKLAANGMSVQGRRINMVFPSLKGMKKAQRQEDVKNSLVTLRYPGEEKEKEYGASIVFSEPAIADASLEVAARTTTTTIKKSGADAEVAFALRAKKGFSDPLKDAAAKPGTDLPAAAAALAESKGAYVLRITGYDYDSTALDANPSLQRVKDSFDYVVRAGTSIVLPVKSPRANQKLKVEILVPAGVKPVEAIEFAFEPVGAPAEKTDKPAEGKEAKAE